MSFSGLLVYSSEKTLSRTLFVTLPISKGKTLGARLFFFAIFLAFERIPGVESVNARAWNSQPLYFDDVTYLPVYSVKRIEPGHLDQAKRQGK